MRVEAVRLTGPIEDSAFQKGLVVLPDQEREKVSRYRQKPDRDRALVSALLARAMAAEANGAALAHMRMERTAYGKPFFPDWPEYHFNVAHSGEWVVCVAADCPVGSMWSRFARSMPV
ncbi:4'-phosphopantetheinyl transferase family protein [Paenibacillus koleovorans]|uniref:4'-phosphopantetheinyl transferase family protein n=1 Tax=Paenibacillus koleovorans TaxID=121608 RepID=UPI000FD9B845|nr:hypothetical protein [Paenibacillus koleovorans]